MPTRLSTWSEADLPEQPGRAVLITGANSGLGLRSAEVLAARGARVLLACRSRERGEQARDSVRREATGPAPELVVLDLADLGSVAECAEEVTSLTGGRLDVLINNAGLMATPKGTTADGFERQFGTNHLGHAALTWLLMPALAAAVSPARVVTLSSIAAAQGKLDLADPHFERRLYNPWWAYGQAKLANQIFALELHRRLRAADSPVTSVAAHPGLTATGLGGNMAESYQGRVLSAILGAGAWFSNTFLAQDVHRGALPQLFAATNEAQAGEYIGPDGLGQLRGHPSVVHPLRPARDPELGARLWELTAAATGITPDPK